MKLSLILCGAAASALSISAARAQAPTTAVTPDHIRFVLSAIIVAGGLNSRNVGRAIQTVRPFAVDVASGVESGPGQKDPALLRAFFAAVKDADRGLLYVAEEV